MEYYNRIVNRNSQIMNRGGEKMVTLQSDLKNIRLIVKRFEKGLSQRALAKEIDMNERTYMYKEIGQNEFKESEISKLLEFFKCTYEELFGQNWTEEVAE